MQENASNLNDASIPVQRPRFSILPEQKLFRILINIKCFLNNSDSEPTCPNSLYRTEYFFISIKI